MSDLKKMYKTVMDDDFPADMTVSFGEQKLVYRKRTWKVSDSNNQLIEKGLRYGENPGQQSAMYELVNGNLILGNCRFISPSNGLVSSITEEDMLQSGKHPGKINLTDIDSGLNILKYLTGKPAAVIMKHNNPCGAACCDTLEEACSKALMADRIAAFGGCAVFNRSVDTSTAALLSEKYLEVVVAPDFEEGSLDILKSRKNLRIIRISNINRLIEYRDKRFVDFKSLIDGGIIVQQSPLNRINSPADFQPAESEYKGTRYKIDRKPTEQEYEDLIFGWSVEQGVTSNSVLYVKNGCTVGIGTGEQDRVGVAELAVIKAYTKYADTLCYKKHGIPYNALRLEIEQNNRPVDLINEIDKETKSAKGGLVGSAMISDAFFPFRDGVDVGIKEGVSAIAHSGGSLRDFESILACNEADPKVAMVFTGQRAFKH